MNKKIVLITCLTLGLTITASALTYKEIKVTTKPQLINYQGTSSQENVLVYEETTYVPLRTFSNILDVSVIYSDDIIYLNDLAEQLTTSKLLSKESAKAIALKHANLKESDVILKPIYLDKEHKRTVYDIEFLKNKIEYDYEIDAYTGEIISYSSDNH